VEDFHRDFTESQRQAFEWIVSRWRKGEPVRCLVTGGAGVGKSFLMDALVSHCRENEMTYKRTATTGMAAALIKGTTLHSFIGWTNTGRSDIEKGTLKSYFLGNTQVVFIDEVSMLTRDVLDLLDNLVTDTACLKM